MGNRQILSILMGLIGKEVFEGGKFCSIWLGYIHCSDFSGLRYRSHMLSIVSIDGQDYLIDVGYGK